MGCNSSVVEEPKRLEWETMAIPADTAPVLLPVPELASNAVVATAAAVTNTLDRSCAGMLGCEGKGDVEEKVLSEPVEPVADSRETVLAKNKDSYAEWKKKYLGAFQPQVIKAFEELYKQHDVDGSGCLEMEEQIKLDRRTRLGMNLDWNADCEAQARKDFEIADLNKDGFNDFVEFVRYTVEQFRCSPAEEMDQGGLVHFVNHIGEIIDDATQVAASS